ncbi:hypothetical protein NXX77_11455 [Phocaeicola dorei]|nr:hypothetical protein [Phocaeicola dorei]
MVLKKKEITLKLTRAAVKFTYEITNKSSRDYWLSVIRIDKSASHEYLLPNGMTYDDAENVTDFQVPKQLNIHRLISYTRRIRN